MNNYLYLAVAVGWTGINRYGDKLEKSFIMFKLAPISDMIERVEQGDYSYG